MAVLPRAARVPRGTACAFLALLRCSVAGYPRTLCVTIPFHFGCQCAGRYTRMKDGDDDSGPQWFSSDGSCSLWDCKGYWLVSHGSLELFQSVHSWKTQGGELLPQDMGGHGGWKSGGQQTQWRRVSAFRVSLPDGTAYCGGCLTLSPTPAPTPPATPAPAPAGGVTTLLPLTTTAAPTAPPTPTPARTPTPAPTPSPTPRPREAVCTGGRCECPIPACECGSWLEYLLCITQRCTTHDCSNCPSSAKVPPGPDAPLKMCKEFVRGAIFAPGKFEVASADTKRSRINFKCAVLANTERMMRAPIELGISCGTSADPSKVTCERSQPGLVPVMAFAGSSDARVNGSLDLCSEAALQPPVVGDPEALATVQGSCPTITEHCTEGREHFIRKECPRIREKVLPKWRHTLKKACPKSKVCHLDTLDNKIKCKAEFSCETVLPLKTYNQLALKTYHFQCDQCQKWMRQSCCDTCQAINPFDVESDIVVCGGCPAGSADYECNGVFDPMTGKFSCKFSEHCMTGTPSVSTSDCDVSCYVTPCGKCTEPCCRAKCCEDCLQSACDSSVRTRAMCLGCDLQDFEGYQPDCSMFGARRLHGVPGGAPPRRQADCEPDPFMGGFPGRPAAAWMWPSGAVLLAVPLAAACALYALRERCSSPLGRSYQALATREPKPP